MYHILDVVHSHSPMQPLATGKAACPGCGTQTQSNASIYIVVGGFSWMWYIARIQCNHLRWGRLLVLDVVHSHSPMQPLAMGKAACPGCGTHTQSNASIYIVVDSHSPMQPFAMGKTACPGCGTQTQSNANIYIVVGGFSWRWYIATVQCNHLRWGRLLVLDVVYRHSLMQAFTLL